MDTVQWKEKIAEILINNPFFPQYTKARCKKGKAVLNMIILSLESLRNCIRNKFNFDFTHPFTFKEFLEKTTKLVLFCKEIKIPNKVGGGH